MIATEKFATLIGARFSDTGKRIAPEALERVLQATGGHPYGTQELAYFVWELTPVGGEAAISDVETALTNVLRSEHNHLTQLWDDASHQQRLLVLAIAAEPTSSVYARTYHERHELPSNPTLQTALSALRKKEIVGRNRQGEYCVIEPFFADWLLREQGGYGLPALSAAGR
jgi:hypothetical protein